MNKQLQNRKNPKFKIAISCVILIFLIIVSMGLGHYEVSIFDTCKILFSKLNDVFGGLIPIEKTWTESMELAVFNIRLPRIVLACLVGACLAVAGASYQGIFVNPMAAPDILGASSGAAFGAAIAILLGFDTIMITVFAFIFSLITVLLVFGVAKLAPGIQVVNLILAGIMTSALFEAGTSYIKLVADTSDKLPKITYWMMGSLANANFQDIALVIIPILIGFVPLFILRWRLNLLTLKDDEARSLGVNTTRTRLFVIICSTLITSAVVSVSGTIGWVGLVIPHLCRKIFGNNYRYLIPSSTVVGAIFLLLVDNFARNLLSVEIPIGILTAVIGVPFFLFLLLRKNQ